MSSSTIPNACPGLRVSGSPGPSSSATSTKSTSPTCERGWQGSSRQDKRGSNYLRTNRQPTSESDIPTVCQALDEDANYKFSEKYPDGKQFFQASKRQVPSFSVNSHPSVQNWSTLRLIYQKARANSRSKTAREKKFFPS